MSSRYTGGVIYNAPGGWSGFFPSNSSLTFGYTSGIALGSTYTIECWINPTSVSQGYLFEMAQSNTGGFSYLVFYISSGQVGSAVRPSTSGTEYYSSAGTVVAGVWQHVALVNTAGTAQLYVNGFAVGATYSMPALSTTPVFCAIGQRANGFSPSGTYYNGYISNLRITTSAVYTSNFTPPSGALLPLANTKLLTCRYPTFVDGSTNAYALTANSATVNTANPFPTSATPNPALGVAGNGIYTLSQYANLLAANQWPAVDPYYENVTLNLHGNAGTVLPFNTDASTNNFQVTQVGDTRPSNYTPFIENGYWSNLFGSNSGLTAPNNSAFKPATNAFTVECWIFSTATGQQVIYGDSDSATNNGVLDLYLTASGFLASDYWTSSAGVTTRTSTLAPIINQWNHVLVSRTGTTMYIGLNGVLQSFTAPSSYQSPATIYPTVGRLGAYAAGVGFTGYISNFRYINGTNLYSGSTYTVPTTPLTAVANTVLLTCQSNRFVDNSTNAFALTVNGSPSVNPLQPFTAPTGTSAYGSGYFDGTGDYLAPTTSSAFAYGTGDLTFECWIYATTASDSPIYESRSTNSNTDGFTVTAFSSTVIRVYTTAVLVTATVSNYTNAWTHVAYTRQGSTNRLFVNGALVATATASDNFSNTTAFIGAGRYSTSSPSAYFTGYISNVRILKGTAQYTATFTPSTTPLTAITNTSLLTVQTNAPSQNNTFLDSSTNNFVITRNGNTTQGTFTPYGPNWSNYFDGSGDYLTTPSSTAFTLGSSGDFTIECWVYLTSTPGNYAPFATTWINASSSYANRWFLGIGTLGRLGWFDSVGNFGINESTSITLNTWLHIAVVRSGSTITMYKNGVSVGTQTTNQSYTTDNAVSIGYIASGSYIQGYISNLRVVKGTAVYTSAFTPSTGPLTAITNTSLLTCADNRFIDDSTNNFTITRNGDVSVQRFSPFSPTSAYSASVIGGSGYFDGSGDYLSFASNDAFRVDQGDWTIEGWVYITSTASNFTLANRGVYVSVYSFYCGSSGTALYYEAGTGGWAATGYTSSSNAVVAGQWNHIAYVRSGTSLFMYSNGVRVFSQTVGSVGANVTAPMWVGQYLGGSAGLNGNMTDFRFVKGTAVYTGSTYTIPTAPLTAITNTSALINYTNAGILDNAMMNDLETVGNAQLSTSVKKYGSASMYFDGTSSSLSVSSNLQNLQFGTGDFTVECWVNKSANGVNSYDSVIGLGSTVNATQGWYLEISTARGIFFIINTVSVSYGTWVNDGFWHHIAVTRSNGTVYIFKDGVLLTSGSLSTAVPTTATTARIGNYYNGSTNFYFSGYIDDLRVTKGVARYTTSFTPPTSQVQDQ